MMNPTTNKESLKDNLKKLAEISDWFDRQEQLDLEEGIQKVKEAAQLIKACNTRLRKIENEFKEIKQDIEKEIGDKESL